MLKTAVIHNQSLIDLAIQQYGGYEGVFLLAQDNASIVEDLGMLFTPGTELKVRNPIPELNEENRTVVSSFLNSNVEVASGVSMFEDGSLILITESGETILSEDGFILYQN